MKRWIKYGLYSGLSMLFAMGIFFPLLDGSFSAIRLLTGLPVFAIFGLLWGYFMFGKQTTKIKRS